VYKLEFQVRLVERLTLFEFSFVILLSVVSFILLNSLCSVPRPEFLGQRVLGHHPPGPVQALVLQGQLLHVQEDGTAETERKVKRTAPKNIFLFFSFVPVSHVTISTV
jgi:hypothetical protein